MSHSIRWLLPLLAWLWLVAPTARAYSLNSNDPNLKGWNTTELRVSVNPTDCPTSYDFMAAVRRGISAWNGISGTEINVVLGNVSSASPRSARSGDASDSPVITCDPSFGETTAMDPNIVPGVGGIAVNLGTNRIIYGYVILNTQQGTGANLEDQTPERAAVVIAHELGHVLGLGHSDVPGALMYPNISGVEAAELSPDDIEGLRHLYAPGSTEELGGGCLSLASAGRGSSGGGLAPFVGLVLVCFIGTRLLRLSERQC